MNQEKKVFRAGTIPYIVEDGKVFMMFMKPSNPEYGGDAFQAAKGRIEEGESAKTAALREAGEELGLFIGNVSLVEELGVFMGRTTMFIARVKSKDMFGLPGLETSDTTWMTLDEFLNEGRSLHRPVIQAAYRAICRIEGIEAP